MSTFRRGDSGPVVAQIRAALAACGRPVSPPAASAPGSNGTWSHSTEEYITEEYDGAVEAAVLAFQQERGLVVDGIVGTETWSQLQAAGRRLGDRLLTYAVSHPFSGDDVADLQGRLLDMGFDVGRRDGTFGRRTEEALKSFQRERGLRVDGVCGPLTLQELSRLARTVKGGNSHGLRESERLRRSGPSLAGQTIVIDAGHGADDTGFTGHGLVERDIVDDIANRLDGRLTVAGTAVLRTHPRRPSPSESNPSERQRAQVANDNLAGVTLSLHCDAAASPLARGVATYYYGSGRDNPSVVGSRLADLVQKEIVARTDLLDCRAHPKTWELLRLTRMPTVRVELGYLSSPEDASRLGSDAFRDTIAEALLVAVQRLFLPVELDPPTGALRLPRRVD